MDLNRRELIFKMKKSIVIMAAAIAVCSSMAGCESKVEKEAREARQTADEAKKVYENTKKEYEELQRDLDDYNEAVESFED